MYILYEIMREAGLRLPQSIGHAVSIVGGLVIGEISVSAGLMSAPVVLIIAATGLCSFAVPDLYDSCMILRLVFIIAGVFFIFVSDVMNRFFGFFWLFSTDI